MAVCSLETVFYRFIALLFLTIFSGCFSQQNKPEAAYLNLQTSSQEWLKLLPASQLNSINSLSTNKITKPALDHINRVKLLRGKARKLSVHKF